MTDIDSKMALSIRVDTVHQCYIPCGAVACNICIGAVLHTFEPLLYFDHSQAMQVLQKPMCFSQLWQCSLPLGKIRLYKSVYLYV